MGETVSFIWPSHGQQLCKGIMGLLKENFGTDFKLLLKADKNGECQALKVHHVVLAIFCPLLKNVTEMKLNLGNYNVEDLNHLVEFIYTGKTTVNKAGLSSLRNCANVIGLKPLLYSIESYVRRQKPADDDDDSQAINHTSSLSSQSTGTTAGDPQSKDTIPKKTQTTPVSTRKPATPIKSRASEIKSRLRPSAKCPMKTRRIVTPPPTKITCQHCSYSADQNVKIISHMAAVHHIDAEGNKLEKNVKCDQCSFTCYTKETLKSHRYLKHNKDPIKCDQCPYVCSTRAGMGKHMVTHSDERPLMCEQCGLRFKIASAYATHLKRHKGLKADCEVCGKSMTLTSLKRHMELHKSDEKPNACHLCSFATRKRYNLRFHLKSVHKVHMDKQGNVLGNYETSLTSKSFVPSSSSAEDDSGDFVVDLNSNSDLLPLFE